jgi:hypothetical protein
MPTEPAPTVSLSLSELTEICTQAVFRALMLQDREHAIVATRADEEAMVAEIEDAEAGRTGGHHSAIASIVSSRLYYRLLPKNPGFEFQSEEIPEDVLRIVEEARRHMQVDLSEFEYRRSPRRGQTPERPAPSQPSE